MLNLQGCGTALVTPFRGDLSVDFEAFRKLVKRQIDAGIHFLVPLGTTGESPCLSADEKLRLLEIAVEEARGKVPVIAGAGSNCTEHVIENLKAFEKAAVDGYLIVTPYYNKPTHGGLIQHFKSIASETVRPIILYNVPGRTGVNLTAETCLALAEVKNIVAVKEASSHYSQISQIIGQAPRHFSVFSGNDNETLSLMATGAKGVISVASNIAPREMVALVESLLAGDIGSARKQHHALTMLFDHCFVETNPIPVKAGLAAMGLIEDVLRPPLYKATEKTVQLIQKTIQALGAK